MFIELCVMLGLVYCPLCTLVEQLIVRYCIVCGIGGRRMEDALSLQDRWTALMWASGTGEMECVKVLLDKGAEVNMQSKVSDVIIHCTVKCHTYK